MSSTGSRSPQLRNDFPRNGQIAAQYHDNLQDAPLDQELSEEETTVNLEEILNSIPEDQTIQNPDVLHLDEEIPLEEVEEGLRNLKSGTAAGLVSCPYELWKALHARRLKGEKNDIPSFNLTSTLTSVYRDIQRHGINDDSEARNRRRPELSGWVDVTDIASPITARLPSSTRITGS
ncbi:hypothetical protein FA95DRAFT_1605299 [Auriscalpium vulgare]|uniref:Uncharacterized protein n=1 Tax=Auriscalpium vulgare TaxID=40419 RepID=A0ACB8RWB8_9AGAM|nr:hypothetical protein FA95DRAFT_1605299 [Auriscalpium vulgare]